MRGERIDIATILRALGSHRAEPDLLADRIAAGRQPVGGLLELGLVRPHVDRLHASHCREIARHAQALVPEQDRWAVEAVVVDAVLCEKSYVEDGAQRGGP